MPKWEEIRAVIYFPGAGPRLTNIRVPKPVFTHRIKSPAYCIAFSADGKAVITGHANQLAIATTLQR
jgi:hypothetical protein